MKKTALIIALFVVVNSVSAQFTIGPKMGLNISKEYFGLKGLDEGIDFKAGFNVGVFGKYEVNHKFDIQAELLYSQQGFKHNIPLTDYGGTVFLNGYKISSHYLNIPLVLKYYHLKRLYIEAGPQVGFCLSSKIHPGYKMIEGDFKKDYNTTDFSLVGGIGADIGYGLSVNARYIHGFTDTQKLSKLNVQNRVIQISLAYDLWSF